MEAEPQVGVKQADPRGRGGQDVLDYPCMACVRPVWTSLQLAIALQGVKCPARDVTGVHEVVICSGALLCLAAGGKLWWKRQGRQTNTNGPPR